MSDKSKQRRSGLGTDAFFQRPQPSEPTSEKPVTAASAEEGVAPSLQETTAAKQQPTPREPAEAKVKTTINLSAGTLALLDALKINARKQKRKATYSDILDEAIRELARIRGIET